MPKTLSKKVFVAMSGGVDSSVAALLFKNQGYDVVGVFMRCWSGGDASLDKLGMNCVWERDSEDARRVAAHLDIPFYVWDFEEEYKKKVVEYMVEGYRKGITPNPDVMCNKEIKFGLFLTRALEAGAEYVATGHYVGIRPHIFWRTELDSLQRRIGSASRSDGSDSVGDQAHRSSESFSSKHADSYSLFEGKDRNKDQSYFLWTLTQEQLAHCLFPIGDYLKSEVQEMARKAGLPTADKKDSQGICFLGQVRLGEFLRNYIEPKVGQVRLAQEGGSYRVIGEHDGAQFYTIGQRHGLVSGSWYLGAGRGDRGPVYVAEKDVATNTLVVAEGEENPALYKKEVQLRDVNFITPHHPYILENVGMKVFARVRYRQSLAPAVLILSNSRELESNEKGGNKIIRAQLIFDKPQKFVAAGQSAVFYTKSGEMVGGGIIV